MEANQDALTMDAIIVGGGLAGLACAIRLARESKGSRQIMLLEKASRAGGHLLSGAVMRPEALEQLLTAEERATLPAGTLVRRDTFHALLPGGRSLRLPFVPPKMRMKGLPMVSVSRLGEALTAVAQKLGVEVVTGQTADALLWDGDQVAGVVSDGEAIRAPVTVIAEGPAGLLTAELLERHPEAAGANGQTYAIGLKELVEIPENPEAAGTVAHTFGYPLPMSLYGGGFIYHIDATHVALGLAVALDYADPQSSPHEWFRQWKRHPLVQAHIAGGKAVAYGARLVPEGGWHSLLKETATPGAMVIGDAAGLVDTMELKGLHLALESGMAAADAILRGGAWRREDVPSLEGLRRTANYRAAFRGGLLVGMGCAGLAWVTRGLLPAGRIAQREERGSLRPLRRAVTPEVPVATAEHSPLDAGIDSDLFLANLHYREGKGHIELRDAAVCRDCVKTFGAPCTRFCPAAVYEASGEEDHPIRVRHENCLQCRCCTLRCPMDNIRWQTPQNGDGPDYRGL